MQKNFFVILSIILLTLILFYVYKYTVDARELNYEYYKIQIILISFLLLGSIFLIFLKIKNSNLCNYFISCCSVWILYI